MISQELEEGKASRNVKKDKMQGQVKSKVKEELGLLLTMIGSTLGTISTYLHLILHFDFSNKKTYFSCRLKVVLQKEHQ